MALERAEVTDLLDRGLAAFQTGKVPEAEAIFLKALSLEPGLGQAHFLMARIRMSQNRFDDAERFARKAVAMAPRAPVVREFLAGVLVRTGRAQTALADCREALAQRPDDFGAACGLFTLLAATGNTEEALEAVKTALRMAPDSRFLKLKSAQLYVETGRFKEAMAEVNDLIAKGEDSALVHRLAGCCLLPMNNAAAAVKAFEKAKAKAPGVFENYTGLSGAYRKLGKIGKARQVTQACLKRWPSYSARSSNAQAQVLVLSAHPGQSFDRPMARNAAYIPNNTISQISAERLSIHFVYIFHPDPVAAARSVGPVDVVFNNVANAEVADAEGFTAAVRKTVGTLGVPVVNAPEAVARTSRRENATVIPANLDILFPKTVLYDFDGKDPGKFADEIADELSLPVLIRQTTSHFDENIKLGTDRNSLGDILADCRQSGWGAFYAIQYLTKEFRPGCFRKLRCTLIDGRFYPCFADFSEHWNVHRLGAESAFMKANPELMEQERAFMEDPAGYIGAENIEKLEALARLMELDFLGVDFNMLEDGSLVIFEANPAMRVLQTRLIPDFPYLADRCAEIHEAFEEMILNKAHR